MDINRMFCFFFTYVALRRQLFEEIWDEKNRDVGKCRPSVVKRLVAERGANGAGYKDEVRVSCLLLFFFLMRSRILFAERE